ncbi:hypothetical protein [Vibrio owensii]|uniref:hypothetical protein n=1 Tax=Vibrio owensii TaxID=696485 RepID=UPI0003A787D9|nr:hypothetical protein [Vibrio owensii]
MKKLLLLGLLSSQTFALQLPFKSVDLVEIDRNMNEVGRRSYMSNNILIKVGGNLTNSTFSCEVKAVYYAIESKLPLIMADCSNFNKPEFLGDEVYYKQETKLFKVYFPK